jgi:MFS transporter, DHA3 family, macrolide efflux protein
VPMANAVHQTLWQAIVPTELQGRVFGARRVLTQAAMPIGLLGAGPLVDSGLGRAITTDSALAALVGTGTEGAAGLVLGIAALLGLATTIALAFARQMRDLDRPAETAGERDERATAEVSR